MTFVNLYSDQFSSVQFSSVQFAFAFFYLLCLPFSKSLYISYFKANLRLVLSAYYKIYFQGVKS